MTDPPLARPPGAHRSALRRRPVCTLDAVKRALRAKTGSDLVCGMVMTRVFLGTGINLKNISPAQNDDPGAVARVIAAVRDAGFAI